MRLTDGRMVHFRTLLSGEKTQKKNLYSRLLRESTAHERLMVVVSNKELALLEALSLREHEIGIPESTVLRFLEREHAELDGAILSDLVRYRYIRAMNRLRVIARDQGYDDLYQKTLQAIKWEGGGCFVSL